MDKIKVCGLENKQSRELFKKLSDQVKNASESEPFNMSNVPTIKDVPQFNKTYEEFAVHYQCIKHNKRHKNEKESNKKIIVAD